MGSIRVANFQLPGSFGLNTQDEVAADQQLRFAGLASNGVIDATGKLVARKDFNILTSGFAGTVETVYTHRKDDGTEVILSAAGGKLYSGTTTLTERADYSGTSTTLNNWQFASLNTKIYAFQAGHTPKVLHEGTYAGESFTGAPWGASPNIVMAAYGRLWAADDAAGSNRFTLWWSNLLDGKVWNAGDAGALSLKNAWPQGQDSIIALAAFSSRLIIFGRNSILMYTLPSDNDPGTMTLTDVISNVGCMARDSVIVTEDGVYFLSDRGVFRIDRLGTVTSLLTLPKMSVFVDSDVATTYASETLIKVRAGYYPKEGWYVLNAPTANKCYVFNLQKKIPQVNIPVVTTWTNASMPFRGFCYDKDGNWYCAGTNGVFKYNTYTPDAAASAYNFEFYSQWLNFGAEERLKHLKYSVLTLKAASGQTGTLRWQIDYKAGTVYTASFTCNAVEFAENPGLGGVKTHVGRSANVAKFGFSIPISGSGVELHHLGIAALTGKTTFR